MDSTCASNKEIAWHAATTELLCCRRVNTSHGTTPLPITTGGDGIASSLLAACRADQMLFKMTYNVRSCVRHCGGPPLVMYLGMGPHLCHTPGHTAAMSDHTTA